MHLSSYMILPALAFAFSTLTTQEFVSSTVARRESNNARKVSRIHESVAREFKKAWSISKSGTVRQEGVVLIFRMKDGYYEARSQGATNQDKSFTFKWHPAIVAIVHTHPNNSNPRPSGPDQRVADRYGVPIFTITTNGMYVYDPATRKTSKVMNGLDWLDSANWTPEIYSMLTGRSIFDVPWRISLYL